MSSGCRFVWEFWTHLFWAPAHPHRRRRSTNLPAESASVFHRCGVEGQAFRNSSWLVGFLACFGLTVPPPPPTSASHGAKRIWATYFGGPEIDGSNRTITNKPFEGRTAWQRWDARAVSGLVRDHAADKPAGQLHRGRERPPKFAGNRTHVRYVMLGMGETFVWVGRWWLERGVFSHEHVSCVSLLIRGTPTWKLDLTSPVSSQLGLIQGELQIGKPDKAIYAGTGLWKDRERRERLTGDRAAYRASFVAVNVVPGLRSHLPQFCIMPPFFLEPRLLQIKRSDGSAPHNLAWPHVPPSATTKRMAEVCKYSALSCIMRCSCIPEQGELSGEEESRAVVEGRFLSMKAHARELGVGQPERVLATGGGSKNTEVWCNFSFPSGR